MSRENYGWFVAWSTTVYLFHQGSPTSAFPLRNTSKVELTIAQLEERETVIG